MVFIWKGPIACLICNFWKIEWKHFLLRHHFSRIIFVTHHLRHIICVTPSTHHLSHTSLSHTIFVIPSFTHIFVIPSFTHIFVIPSFTHHLSHTTLSHTTLSHTIFQTQPWHTHTHTCLAFHTQLCHTPSFTHIFVTHYLCPHATFHTQLCHTRSFTHIFVTHRLCHTHTTFHTHFFSHNFVHTQFFSNNFVTHTQTFLNVRFSTISFVLSAFSVPLQPLFSDYG